MSDDHHQMEEHINLRRPIHICDDVCLDLFHSLAPAKVGLELAIVSSRFDALVHTHLKSRKWTLGKLSICSKRIFKYNDDGSVQQLPIPQSPLPNSVVDFARIDSHWITPDVRAFLQRIGRLLEQDIGLMLYICRGDGESKKNWKGRGVVGFATTPCCSSVLPMLNALAITKMRCRNPSVFHLFRTVTCTDVLLANCPNLRYISFNDGLLEFPPDDRHGTSDGQALCKWLYTPRPDGRPKVLKSGTSRKHFPMEALKTSFLNATTSVSFVIRLRSLPTGGPIELVNLFTCERLTIGTIGNDGWWLIERSPMAKNVAKWAEWERQALEDGANSWKVFGIGLCG